MFFSNQLSHHVSSRIHSVSRFFKTRKLTLFENLGLSHIPMADFSFSQSSTDLDIAFPLDDISWSSSSCRLGLPADTPVTPIISEFDNTQARVFRSPSPSTGQHIFTIPQVTYTQGCPSKKADFGVISPSTVVFRLHSSHSRRSTIHCLPRVRVQVPQCPSFCVARDIIHIHG